MQKNNCIRVNGVIFACGLMAVGLLVYTACALPAAFKNSSDEPVIFWLDLGGFVLSLVAILCLAPCFYTRHRRRSSGRALECPKCTAGSVASDQSFERLSMTT